MTLLTKLLNESRNHFFHLIVRSHSFIWLSSKEKTAKTNKLSKSLCSIFQIFWLKNELLIHFIIKLMIQMFNELLPSVFHWIIFLPFFIESFYAFFVQINDVLVFCLNQRCIEFSNQISVIHDKLHLQIIRQIIGSFIQKNSTYFLQVQQKKRVNNHFEEYRISCLIVFYFVYENIASPNINWDCSKSILFDIIKCIPKLDQFFNWN